MDLILLSCIILIAAILSFVLQTQRRFTFCVYQIGYYFNHRVDDAVNLDPILHVNLNVVTKYPFLFPFYLHLFSLQDFYRTWLRVTRRVSYKKQELHTIREYMGSPEVRVAHPFLSCGFCFVCIRSMSCY